MPEETEEQAVSTSNHTVRNILLAVAAVYVIVSLYFIFDMRGRLDKMEAAQTKAATETAQLMKRLGVTEENLRATSETLSEKVGVTQKTIADRAAQLHKEQLAAEQRLAQQQKEQIGQVSGEVAGVKTELGGAKTDIATNRTELEATKSKLERVIGDLGVQSGLVARTREDLEALKHKGDRNYYEFTLVKKARPTPISTISLQLKKVDAKKGKFSLNVLADDRTIEKKDRTVFEPLQFYTGRDRMLYEVVVLTAEKNRISGYLSTPKTAPAPMTQ
jgi:hypothetical protein